MTKSKKKVPSVWGRSIVEIAELFGCTGVAIQDIANSQEYVAPNTKNKIFLQSKVLDTRLHQVVSLYGDTGEITELLEMGININARNIQGETALFVAVERSISKTIWELCDRDFCDSYSRMHSISFLLDRGADVNICDRSGISPLHKAAERGHIEVINALLDKGANIEARDAIGNTPLFYAIMGDPILNYPCEHPFEVYCELDVVRFLLENGANINAKNNADKTPLDYANEMNKHEMIELLRKAGAE